MAQNLIKKRERKYKLTIHPMLNGMKPTDRTTFLNYQPYEEMEGYS